MLILYTRWQVNHFEFQIYRHKRRRFWMAEGNKNLDKFFPLWWKRRNLWELLRNQPAVHSLWIGCSSNCFEYRRACMPRRLIKKWSKGNYLERLSFYCAPSRLQYKLTNVALIKMQRMVAHTTKYRASYLDKLDTFDWRNENKQFCSRLEYDKKKTLES